MKKKFKTGDRVVVKFYDNDMLIGTVREVVAVETGIIRNILIEL
jgi:hypothetical protein